MTNIASRTPEGQPNTCPVCGKYAEIEPSFPAGDAPCPHCGSLLWFVSTNAGLFFFEKPSPGYAALFPIGHAGSVSAAAVTLSARKVIVGRRRTCHVVIDEPNVSALHCELTFERQGLSVRDLGSKNGTRVNGKKIKSRMKLRSGDTLTIGRRQFVIQFNDGGNRR